MSDAETYAPGTVGAIFADRDATDSALAEGFVVGDIEAKDDEAEVESSEEDAETEEETAAVLTIAMLTGEASDTVEEPDAGEADTVGTLAAEGRRSSTRRLD